MVVIQATVEEVHTVAWAVVLLLMVVQQAMAAHQTNTVVAVEAMVASAKVPLIRLIHRMGKMTQLRQVWAAAVEDTQELNLQQQRVSGALQRRPLPSHQSRCHQLITRPQT
jgi:predicted anti-sigma-YlaC factor YlaD